MMKSRYFEPEPPLVHDLIGRALKRVLLMSPFEDWKCRPQTVQYNSIKALKRPTIGFN